MRRLRCPRAPRSSPWSPTSRRSSRWRTSAARPSRPSARSTSCATTRGSVPGERSSRSPLADWEWILGVNLWGVIHGVRTFLPLLQDQGEGHIVNTASVAGLFSAPYMGPYNVSKYGVVALSETLFTELAIAQSNVGVSVLCPSWVQDPHRRVGPQPTRWARRPGGGGGDHRGDQRLHLHRHRPRRRGRSGGRGGQGPSVLDPHPRGHPRRGQRPHRLDPRRRRAARSSCTDRLSQGLRTVGACPSSPCCCPTGAPAVARRARRRVGPASPPCVRRRSSTRRPGSTPSPPSSATTRSPAPWSPR